MWPRQPGRGRRLLVGSCGQPCGERRPSTVFAAHGIPAWPTLDDESDGGFTSDIPGIAGLHAVSRRRRGSPPGYGHVRQQRCAVTKRLWTTLWRLGLYRWQSDVSSEPIWMAGMARRGPPGMSRIAAIRRATRHPGHGWAPDIRREGGRSQWRARVSRIAFATARRSGARDHGGSENSGCILSPQQPRTISAFCHAIAGTVSRWALALTRSLAGLGRDHSRWSRRGVSAFARAALRRRSRTSRHPHPHNGVRAA
jgi:hypothetical protein